MGAEPSLAAEIASEGGEATEVTAIAAFIASEEAAYITGADYFINGGRTLGPLR